MTVKSMLQLFVSGKEAQFSIRFVEGSKLADWQKILSEAPYLKQTLADLPADKLTEMLGLPAGSHRKGVSTRIPISIQPEQKTRKS